jgi:hypothetical protein
MLVRARGCEPFLRKRMAWNRATITFHFRMATPAIDRPPHLTKTDSMLLADGVEPGTVHIRPYRAAGAAEAGWAQHRYAYEAA